jgi:hypothetical protein
MPNALHRLLRSGIVHVLFAFLAMGSCAVFANRAHAMPLPLYAGLVQGTISACLTLFLKSVIDWLSKRFVGSVRFWAPASHCLYRLSQHSRGNPCGDRHAGNTQDHRISAARIDELRGNLQLFDLGKTRCRYMMGRLRCRKQRRACGRLHSFTAPVIEET